MEIDLIECINSCLNADRRTTARQARFLLHTILDNLNSGKLAITDDFKDYKLFTTTTITGELTRITAVDDNTYTAELTIQRGKTNAE